MLDVNPGLPAALEMPDYRVPRPFGPNVSFSAIFVGSSPESRRGTSSRFSSARDPHETLALGQETAMNCSDRNPDSRSYPDGANVFGQWEAVPSRSEEEPAVGVIAGSSEILARL